MSTKILFLFEKITYFAYLIQSWLNGIFEFQVGSRIFTKSLFSLEAETLALFTSEKGEISSANRLTLVVRPSGRSLM